MLWMLLSLSQSYLAMRVPHSSARRTVHLAARVVVAEVANCVLTHGDGMFVDFDIPDWRTGKAVGHFHWGKLEMH
jgi:hypothetical protein